MRELKFRAWNPTLKCMLYSKELGGFFDHEIYPNRDWEIQQFTGLTDKKGKDIYEGDIVEAIANYHGKETDIKFSAKIIYNDNIGSFQISYKNMNDLFVNDDIWVKYFLRVIGNIHEHTELLK